MAQDTELQRLAEVQERAFKRRQEAYETMQRAWERRSSARDAMNRAYDAKQRAYEELDRTWQRYQSVRSANGPRIDSLNAQQEAAYQNMKSSFEAASSAYDRGDKASAKSLAEDGHRYKAEAQRYVAERRSLVEEIKAARAQHEAAKPAFERAKEDFRVAKQAFDKAKAEHESLALSVLDKARQDGRRDLCVEQEDYRSAVARSRAVEAELGCIENCLKWSALLFAEINPLWYCSAIVKFDVGLNRFEIAYGNVGDTIIRPTVDDFDGLCTVSRDSAGRWERQQWRTPSS